MSRNYRLRITDALRNVTYITRRDGRVSYLRGNEQMISLSFLLGDEAAEGRFMLEDTKDGATARLDLHRMLTRRWEANHSNQPKIEELGCNT